MPSPSRILACLAALGLSVAHSIGVESDFPQPGNVVIAPGIAGDTDSEKSHEDTLSQLLTWLGGLQPKPERVFVLSDLKVSPPIDLAVQRLDPTRKEFLALAPQLRGKPLTLFAWGHAGMQGKTPVFHVRGPRIEPADFVSLAEAAGGNSDWILMFIGSGDFAKALQADGRRILSSEGRTRFTSDPFGMSLLSRILPTASNLPALGKALGVATDRYYEGRRLVRVEEPTLWIGKAEPQKLAPDAPLESPLAGPALKTEDAAPHKWTSIQRVRAEDFPDNEGVVLKRKILYVLGESTASMEEREEIIQILTPEGKELGDFNISFNPPDENLEFLACEVLGADGKIQKVDPESIREVDQKAWADYAGPSRKVFSMPNIGPGALLHVHYRRSWKRYPLPYISFDIDLGGAAPTLATTVEVRLSTKSAFHFALRGFDQIDPKVETREYSQIYRWEFPRTDASRHEPLTPSGSEPALLISTYPDWRSFSEWYRRLIKLADEPTPELTAKAKELTEGLKTQTEKARAIYEFVTSLRYVAVPMGVNSHRPHAAGNVFRNRFGDCKDKANLYNTMLRTVGIEADLVLVPRFDQANEATPGLAFNHAISRLKIDGKAVFADTTDDVCRFGLLPPGDPGRNVLVIDESTRSLTALPQGGPADHTLVLEQDIDLTGDRPTASLSANATGYFDYALRTAARQIAATRTSYPIVQAVAKSQSGEFRLKRQQFTPVSALDKPFQWKATGDYSRMLTPLPGGSDRLLTAPLGFPAEWTLAANQRTRPLLLNQGYPGRIDQRIMLHLPPKSSEPRLPDPARGTSPLLTWSIEWKKLDASKIDVRCRVEWPRAELSLAEVPTFQQELEKLKAAADIPAVVHSAVE